METASRTGRWRRLRRATQGSSTATPPTPRSRSLPPPSARSCRPNGSRESSTRSPGRSASGFQTGTQRMSGLACSTPGADSWRVWAVSASRSWLSRTSIGPPSPSSTSWSSSTAALADAAVLTPCTARPEFLDDREAWGGGLRDTTSIRLQPLPADESTRLVEALVGSRGLTTGVTERIVERAEGNPFYVEEILQMLDRPGRGRASERRLGGARADRRDRAP